MLILIGGVTGNLGQRLCRSALSRGHQVRGFARNPDKLEPSLRSQLESFVVTTDYLNQAEYEKACEGVDAIVAAFWAVSELILDAQLLLRAAEKAGIRRYHAATWNGD
jgi:uncharacterized protein YbjT (DUF2867 family)